MTNLSTFLGGAAALALTLATAAPPAFAQGGVAQPGFYAGDLGAFHGDQMSLINAIHHIHQASGDRIVDIRFAREGGLAGYHVVLQHAGRFTFMHISEQNGQVVSIAAASAPDWMLKWNQRADLRWDRLATVTLPQAIRTAERAYNAPAVAAGIATSASNPSSAVHAYNIILDTGGTTRRVAVDASTGQIIADPSALSDWS
jgi:uncharacterized membrane protein YkoI